CIALGVAGVRLTVVSQDDATVRVDIEGRSQGIRWHDDSIGRREWFGDLALGGAPKRVDAFIERGSLVGTGEPELVGGVFARLPVCIASTPDRCARDRCVRSRSEAP